MAKATSGITGHPKGLYMLFFAEMWERFMFYGNRALLILFMVNYLGYEDAKGNLIYGATQALIYTMPLFGGMLADRILGQRKAVMFGGIVMALGSFLMIVPQEIFFYIGLGFIICGNGFFKPNISTMVGDLYEVNDVRKDSAFSLFYMGINFGALLGSIVCGLVGQYYSWHLGFGLAGIFMLIGLVVFYRWKHLLGKAGLPPGTVSTSGEVMNNPAAIINQRSFLGLSWEVTVYIFALLCVPLFVLLLLNYEVMDYVMNPMAGLALVVMLVFAFTQPSKEARHKLFAAIVMIIFSVLFWGFYEQGGGSLNLFTERNVDLSLFGGSKSAAAVNNSINPLLVILFSPVFAWIWAALANKKLEPNTPMKFGISFLMLSLGFYVFVLGSKASSDGIVSIGYFILGYVFLTVGELCISPIGLSMITKLSPGKLVGMMMGAWFLASAMGQFVAGKIGALMAIPEGTTDDQVDPLISLPIYNDMFEYIAMVALGAGVLLLLLVPVIKKWMHGIH